MYILPRMNLFISGTGPCCSTLSIFKKVKGLPQSVIRHRRHNSFEPPDPRTPIKERSQQGNVMIYEMYTFLTSDRSKISPVIGSLTFPSGTPAFLLISDKRPIPYIRWFGRTTGSFSTELFVWWAYGTCLASSFNSVEQIGHIEVVREFGLALEEAIAE